MQKLYFPFIIALVIVLLGVSCADPKPSPQNSSCIVIDLDQLVQADSLKFSQMFDSAWIIPLDTAVQAIIGEIRKVTIEDGFIFILDASIAKTVYMFDRQGNFIRKIGNPGNGRGEYISPVDIAVDKANKRIFVLDRRVQRIHIYNYMTGEHLSSIAIPFFSNNLLYYQNALYTDCPGDKGGAIVRKTDDEGKNPEFFLSVTEHNKGWKFTLANQDGMFLSENSDVPKVTHLVMDTVFRISKDGIYPYLAFHSKEMISAEDLEGLDVDRNPMHMVEWMNKNKYRDLQTYIENDDYLFFNMQKKGIKLHPFLYDKQSKTTQRYKAWYEDMLFDRVEFPKNNLRFGGTTATGAYFFLSSEQTADVERLKEKPAISKGDAFNGIMLCYAYKK